MPSIQIGTGWLDRSLDLGVERFSGLVEQQDRRVLDHSATIAMRWRWPPEKLDAALADTASKPRRP